MIVGTTPLIATDTTVRARLAARTAVDVLPELMAGAEDALGRSLVVITSSATVAVTGARFRDVAVPVILLEPNLMGLMEMTPERPASHGATPQMETQLTIVAATHPLAAGLENDVTVYRMPWRLTWGVPGPDALAVAHVVGRPDHLAIFAYQKGATMVGGAAPARRLGFFLHDNTADNVTPNAVKLLDAAIKWMIDAGTTPCPASAE
jgi:hypothetical protein